MEITIEDTLMKHHSPNLKPERKSKFLWPRSSSYRPPKMPNERVFMDLSPHTPLLPLFRVTFMEWANSEETEERE